MATCSETTLNCKQEHGLEQSKAISYLTVNKTTSTKPKAEDHSNAKTRHILELTCGTLYVTSFDEGQTHAQH